jgi:hypothetical protein
MPALPVRRARMPRSREKPQDRKAGPALHAINNPSLLARYSIQLVNEVVNCGVGGARLAVAVGTEVTRCPPRGPVLALLAHTVLTLD